MQFMLFYYYIVISSVILNRKGVCLGGRGTVSSIVLSYLWKEAVFEPAALRADAPVPSARR